jgi:hypothetical protein
MKVYHIHRIINVKVQHLIDVRTAQVNLDPDFMTGPPSIEDRDRSTPSRCYLKGHQIHLISYWQWALRRLRSLSPHLSHQPGNVMRTSTPSHRPLAVVTFPYWFGLEQ